MKRTTILLVALAVLPLLAACQKAATQGGGIDMDNLYYEETKGWTAAVEYADANEQYYSSRISNTQQLLSTLGNVDEEDVGSNESKYTEMTTLANELLQLYKDGAGPDQTTPKVTQLVQIAKSLPGKDMAYDSYWEVPGTGEE